MLNTENWDNATKRSLRRARRYARRADRNFGHRGGSVSSVMFTSAPGQIA